MNPIAIFFLGFSLVGFLDKFIGGKFGLAKPFDEGMSLIGELLVYILGVYCVGFTLASDFAPAIAKATSDWFFDPSIISGSMLASDLGGYPISTTISADDITGRFSGIVIGGTLGTLISFYLPVYLSSIKGNDSKLLILGFLCGIAVLPITLIIGGMMIGLNLISIIKNLIPVFIFCLTLLVGLIKAEKIATVALDVFGKTFRIFTFGSFLLVIIGLLFSKLATIDQSLAMSTAVMIIKMGITISGSLVLVQIVRKIFKKQLESLTLKLGINEWSLLGMMVGIPAGVAMVPLFHKMDNKGKVINGAFAVSSHYALGGQMAFIANVDSPSLPIFLFVKFTGGILAVFVAHLVFKRKTSKESHL